MITDHLNRTFETLRISLTDVCNFACSYCVSGNKNLVKKEMLQPHEFVSIIKAINELTPLNKIRLTGGEPLLYPSIEKLISGIRNIHVSNISMTTNGLLLKEKLIYQTID